MQQRGLPDADRSAHDRNGTRAASTLREQRVQPAQLLLTFEQRRTGRFAQHRSDARQHGHPALLETATRIMATPPGQPLEQATASQIPILRALHVITRSADSGAESVCGRSPDAVIRAAPSRHSTATSPPAENPSVQAAKAPEIGLFAAQRIL